MREATTALIAKKVGAIEIYGNSAHAAFESIIKVAKENKVPVFSPSPFEVVKGATAAFFPDFQEGGVVAGGMVAKALKGESLASVPFYKLEKTKTSVAGEVRGGSDSSPVTVRAVPSYDGAGGAVVRLEGRLDAEGALELEDILAQFLREGVRTATVDLSRVTYMSTPALHVLARGGHRVRDGEGRAPGSGTERGDPAAIRRRRPDEVAGAGSGGAAADGEPAILRRAQLAPRARVNGGWRASWCCCTGCMRARRGTRARASSASCWVIPAWLERGSSTRPTPARCRWARMRSGSEWARSGTPSPRPARDW